MPYSPQHIKEKLRQSYQNIAEDFSASRGKSWPEFEIMNRWIPEDSTVLDLGCGNGRFYFYLQQEAKKTVDYTGVDFSSALLDIARKKYPKQDFVEQDITALDLPRKFDRIVSIAAFHHLPSLKYRKQTLKKIIHHLEDDGKLLLSVWNLWQRRYWRQHLRAWWTWIRSGFRSDRKGLYIPFGKQKTPRYYHAFSRRELKRLLNMAGLQIEHFEISRHNYVFVCSRQMLKAHSHPVPLTQRFAKRVDASPVATYNPGRNA